MYDFLMWHLLEKRIINISMYIVQNNRKNAYCIILSDDNATFHVHPYVKFSLQFPYSVVFL